MKNYIFFIAIINIITTNSNAIQLGTIAIGSVQNIKLKCNYSKGFIWEVVKHNSITIMNRSDIHIKNNNKVHEISLFQRKMFLKNTKTGGVNDCWLIFKVNKPTDEYKKNYIKLKYIQPFNTKVIKKEKDKIINWVLK